jgi:hypothetical protein
MSTKKTYARISCTLPEDVLAEADRIAAREDRSRSWVIAEALRLYASPVRSQVVTTRETAAPPYAPGLGESRLAQLRADLSLSPEARVRAAEESAALSALLRPSRGARLLQFDRFDDYLEWKRREAAQR